MRDKIK